MPANTPANRYAIEVQLGPRGHTQIDSANRALARQWIAAMGWGRAFADVLTLRELNIAYNSPGRHGGERGDAYLEKRLAAFEQRQRGGLFDGEGKAPPNDGKAPNWAPEPDMDKQDGRENVGMGDLPEGIQEEAEKALGRKGAPDGNPYGEADEPPPNLDDVFKGKGKGKEGNQDQDQDQDQDKAKAKEDLAQLFRQFHDERLLKALAREQNQGRDKADELASVISKGFGGQPQEIDKDALGAFIDAKVKEGLRNAKGAYAPQRIEVVKDGVLLGKVEGRTPPWFARVLKLLMKGQNVMLVGPAGCGKSHNCATLAKAMGVEFGMISGSAGASESQLSGWLLPIGDGGRFVYVPSDFVKKYEAGKTLFCLDELDAFDPNMLVMSNGATANGHFYVPHRYEAPCVVRGENAMIIATANTFGTGGNVMYAGRNALDMTTIDRYIIVECDYDVALEKEIAEAGGLTESEADQLWSIRDKVRKACLRRVISTRAFQKAVAMKAIGDDWRTIVNTLVAGWTPDERAKAGVA